MRILRILIFLTTPFAFSCTSFTVISHYNEKADFSKYKTFKTVNDIGRSGNEDDYAGLDELARAIVKQMDDRGYNEQSDGDLGVHYRIIMDRKVDYRVDPYNYPGSYSNSTYATARRYTEGVLLIEIRDRDTRKVVWQASLDLRINKKKKKGNVIYDSVDLIFKNYPFLAGKKDPVIKIEN